MLKWINKINSPKGLKTIPLGKLPDVAKEYRRFLIKTVSKTGGHLGASLGTVELCIALHYVLNSPSDKICWDVGHQAYVHKMITGRRDRMLTLRQPGGLSGFPSPFESPHDPFVVGHAGTAISQALGLAVTRDIKGNKNNVIAVVGDGALTAGLSYEALNNAGNLKKNMLIILNDNEMSISKNVGAISKYLNEVITNPIYNRVRREVEKQLDHFPRLQRLANVGLEGMKHIFVPGIIFEELGFRYFGPIDGHDVIGTVKTLRKVLSLRSCCLLHVVTQKGKGYAFAEKDAEKLHGVTPFNIRTGEKVQGSKETKSQETDSGVSYTDAFADALVKSARQDQDIVAITAAMPSGTGLNVFQKEFPERFFDVGIAEQHAVTFAGALAKGGLKPVCAIYSSFLQRSHDSIIHDVALQRQKLILAMDRAGLVGGDGATHNGVFDISFLSHVPHTVVGAPKDAWEMEQMFKLALEYPHIFALRFPRANIPERFMDAVVQPFGIGQGEILVEGSDATLLCLGSTVIIALKAAEQLQREGIRVRVANMRFAKPLDASLIFDSLSKSRFLFTLEEHVFAGGFGARVLELLERHNIAGSVVHRFALPDQFIEHGLREQLFDAFGLSPEKVSGKVIEVLRSKDPLSLSPS